MRSKFPINPFFSFAKTICLASLFVCCIASSSQAEQFADSIRSRPDLGAPRRALLVEKTEKITGWGDLDFDANGILRSGRPEPARGSRTARNLLALAMDGKTMIVLEDASGREDVVFCGVAEGRWKSPAAGDPPVRIIQIDFADFSHIIGDKAALDAFDVGWGVLHEIEHVVNDSTDPQRSREVGECERLVNQMRRECGLAERAEYFYSYFPGAGEGGFMTKVVRLAFDKLESGKRKRHWIVWDAKMVGGLNRNVSMALSR